MYSKGLSTVSPDELRVRLVVGRPPFTASFEAATTLANLEEVVRAPGEVIRHEINRMARKLSFPELAEPPKLFGR